MRLFVSILFSGLSVFSDCLVHQLLILVAHRTFAVEDQVAIFVNKHKYELVVYIRQFPRIAQAMVVIGKVELWNMFAKHHFYY